MGMNVGVDRSVLLQQLQQTNNKLGINQQNTSANNQAIDANNQAIQNNANSIQENSSAIQGAETRIAGFETSITSVGNQKTGINQEINALRQALDNPVDEENIDRSDIENQLHSKELSLQELDEELQQLQQQKADAEKAKAQAEQKQALLQQAEADLQTKGESLDGTKAQLSEETTVLTEEKVKLETQIEQAKAEEAGEAKDVSETEKADAAQKAENDGDVKEVKDETEVSDAEAEPEEEQPKYQEVAVQNNKGWEYYAKLELQNEGSEITNKALADKAAEIKQRNIDAGKVGKNGNLIVGKDKTLLLKDSVDTEKFQTGEQAVSRYKQGQERLERERQAEEARLAQEQADAAETAELKQKAEHKAAMEKEADPIAKSMFEHVDSSLEGIAGTSVQNIKNEDLPKVNSDNIVEVFRAYDKYSDNGDNLLEAIHSEGEQKYGIQEKHNVTKTLVTTLYDRAIQAGISDEQAKGYLNNIVSIDSQGYTHCKKGGSESLNGLLKAIENKESLSSNQKESIKNSNQVQLQNQTVNMIDDNLKTAEIDFKDYKDSAGWLDKTVDAACFWSNNKADLVEADLEKYKENLKELDGLKNNETAFKAKFKEIYGVEYDPVQIQAFENLSQGYQDAVVADYNEKAFNSSMQQILNIPDLSVFSDKDIVIQDESGNEYKSNPREKAYDIAMNTYTRTMSKLNGMSKADAEKFLDNAMSAKGIDPKTATKEERYKVLYDMTKATSDSLTDIANNARGGKTIEEVQKNYDDSYNAAFGTKNNAMKRVSDYVQSQKTAVSIAKTTGEVVAVVAITAATGGVGLVGSAALAAATGAALDASNVYSSQNGMTTEESARIAKEGLLDFATGLIPGAGKGVSKATEKYLLKSMKSTLGKKAIKTAADGTTQYGLNLVASGGDYKAAAINTIADNAIIGKGSNVGKAKDQHLTQDVLVSDTKTYYGTDNTKSLSTEQKQEQKRKLNNTLLNFQQNQNLEELTEEGKKKKLLLNNPLI